MWKNEKCSRIANMKIVKILLFLWNEGQWMAVKVCECCFCVGSKRIELKVLVCVYDTDCK